VPVGRKARVMRFEIRSTTVPHIMCANRAMMDEALRFVSVPFFIIRSLGSHVHTIVCVQCILARPREKQMNRNKTQNALKLLGTTEALLEGTSS